MYLLIILTIIGSRYAQVGLKEELSWLKMVRECLLTMELLRMGQFPRDLSIKEISMISLSQQKIGIYYKDRFWAEECFDYIVSQIPTEMIQRKIKSKHEMSCTLTNGDYIKTVRADGSCRGFRVTSAIIQEGISDKIIKEVIYPCIRYPVAIIRDVKEIVPGYVAMKQELPRKKKFVKIKVRY